MGDFEDYMKLARQGGYKSELRGNQKDFEQKFKMTAVQHVSIIL